MWAVEYRENCRTALSGSVQGRVLVRGRGRGQASVFKELATGTWGLDLASKLGGKQGL